MDAFLIEEGVESATLDLEGGEQIAGADLRGLVERASGVKANVAPGAARAGLRLEQAALAGLLKPAVLRRMPRAAERLNLFAEEGEDTWRAI